jgi:tRNA pseudouridine13 synthase
MKLKQRPGDFQVEELTDVVPGQQGPFALYRMEKEGWSTPDAMQAVRRRWKIDLRRLSYGGLKDRHAQTVQFFTIFRGPQGSLTHHGVRVSYLGQVPAAYTSKDIRANRFRLTLRDFGPRAVEAAAQALEEVRAEGVPNYFDDQRFGSVSRAGAFMAREMVLGRYEEALRLALTAPYEYDRGPQKKEKAILQACWGQWAICKDRLSRGHARSLIDYLALHPGDFRGALVRLRPDLRGLYLSAYQSYLWNRMLARWLGQHLRPDQRTLVSLRLGPVPMHRRLDEGQRAELAALRLPLPTARLKADPEDPHAALARSILAEDGVEIEQLRLKGLPELFFSKGERAALCVPADLQHAVGNDELHRGRRKLLLAFDLPRGAYATLIVKRITAAPRRPTSSELPPGPAR